MNTVKTDKFSFDARNREFLIPEGYKSLSLFSVTGQKVYSMDVQNRASLKLNASIRKGLYMAVLKGSKGMSSLRINVVE